MRPATEAVPKPMNNKEPTFVDKDNAPVTLPDFCERWALSEDAREVCVGLAARIGPGQYWCKD